MVFPMRPWQSGAGSALRAGQACALPPYRGALAPTTSQASLAHLSGFAAMREVRAPCSVCKGQDGPCPKRSELAGLARARRGGCRAHCGLRSGRRSPGPAIEGKRAALTAVACRKPLGAASFFRIASLDSTSHSPAPYPSTITALEVVDCSLSGRISRYSGEAKHCRSFSALSNCMTITRSGVQLPAMGVTFPPRTR